MITETIISKAALAREIGVTKARVSQLISSGLPVRLDGKIDRVVALEWVKGNARRPNRRERLNLGARVGAERALASLAAEAIDDRYEGVVQISVMANSSFEIADVLLRHRVPGARELVDEINAEIVRTAAHFCEDLVVDGVVPRPLECANWSLHQWFRATPISDIEWDECVKEASYPRSAVGASHHGV